MAQDTVDAAVQCKDVGQKKTATIDVLNCEMPDRYRKVRGKRVLRSLLNSLRLRRSASVDISQPDPSFKVSYLGNVVTGWAKGDGCVEKPLATLWRNYTQSSRPDVSMQLTVSGGGLKATTKDHGLTEYWANRLTFCSAPSHFPRIFCWVYRHEGRRLKHELRCHAVLCSSSTIASQIEVNLKHSLSLALTEFKKDKVHRQNARLSLVNSIYDNPTMPRRKILLSTGSNNYRPPLERSKSAPKLVSIEENLEEEEENLDGRSAIPNTNRKVFRHYDSTSALLDKQKRLISNAQNVPRQVKVPVSADYSRADENLTDKHLSTSKVKFSDNVMFSGISENLEMSVDEKSTLILESLAQDSLANSILESNSEQAWFRNLKCGSDLTVGIDSDDGSLSSGCESASTVTSDLEQTQFTTIKEIQEEPIPPNVDHLLSESHDNGGKTEFDFKIGSCVLNRVRSLERLRDLHKFCGLNSSLSTTNILNEAVSLIPVGECQSDFSSLRVYKRQSNSDPSLNVNIYSIENSYQTADIEDQTHDEGYDEVIDCASSVANIVLV